MGRKKATFRPFSLEDKKQPVKKPKEPKEKPSAMENKTPMEVREGTKTFTQNDPGISENRTSNGCSKSNGQNEKLTKRDSSTDKRNVRRDSVMSDSDDDASKTKKKSHSRSRSKTRSKDRKRETYTPDKDDDPSESEKSHSRKRSKDKKRETSRPDEDDESSKSKKRGHSRKRSKDKKRGSSRPDEDDASESKNKSHSRKRSKDKKRGTSRSDKDDESSSHSRNSSKDRKLEPSTRDKDDATRSQDKTRKCKLDRDRYNRTQGDGPLRPSSSEIKKTSQERPAEDSKVANSWENTTFEFPNLSAASSSHDQSDGDITINSSWSPPSEPKPKPHYPIFRGKTAKRSSSQTRSQHILDLSSYDVHMRKNNCNIDFETIEEKEQDLFAMPPDFSLAHCVAEDMSMGAGIAVQFRRDFKSVPELLNQRQKQGGLAFLQKDDRYIYYLVTKRDSTGKPTYQTLFNSLLKLKTHMLENKVKKLAMPRIGCGLDRLEWTKVKYMLEYIFKGDDVEIVICNFQQGEGGSPTPDNRQKNNPCKVFHQYYPIQDIVGPGTIIVYFTSEDCEVTEVMTNLNKKFHFSLQFKTARKELGKVIVFDDKTGGFRLYGCVVKKNRSDPFDFEALSKCAFAINKDNNKLRMEYVGFQVVQDKDDEILHTKIINVLKYDLRNVYLYVCYPKSIEYLAPRKY